MIRPKLIALATCLVMAAVLTAYSSYRTEAYFSDTKEGAFTGTLGSWGDPFDVEAGTSTARHSDQSGSGIKIMPIAYFDFEGRLYLDFGDVSPGNHDLSPDVFRIVCHGSTAQPVSFRLDGPAGELVERIELSGRISFIAPGSAAQVRVQITVSADQAPGEYTGELIVLIGDEELTVPLLVTVRSVGEKPHPRPTQQATQPPVDEPDSTVLSPEATPLPEETPDQVTTPSAAPTGNPVTPVATPVG